MSVLVIYYHEIVQNGGFSYQKKQLSSFKREMLYLKNNSDKHPVISFSDYLNKKFDNAKNNIIISFDDGFKSVYQYAFPILKELGLKFSIYIATSFIDSSQEYLSTSNIQEMIDSGLAEICGHTDTHIDCSLASEDDLKKEIEKSNEFFENGLRIEKPQVFCFPYGRYSTKNVRFLFNLCQYKILLGSFYGFLKNAKKVQPRIGISNNDSLKIFVDKLHGRYNWKRIIQIIRAKKR